MLYPKYLRRFLSLSSFHFMSPDEGGGGGTGAAPAAGAATVTVTTPPASASQINAADHQRAIDDMLKHKNTAATLQAELDAIKNGKLKETNDFKTLAEKYESELATERANNKKIQEAIIDDKRTSALKAKVAAMGLRPEAESDLESLDLSGLRIETTSTGKINVLGVGEYAERLKATKPHWFADKTNPNVNTTSPRVTDSGDAVTPQDLIAAERAGRKSKDMSTYTALHAKYQQQRSRRG